MRRLRFAPKFAVLATVSVAAIAGVVTDTMSSGVAAPSETVTGKLIEHTADDFKGGEDVPLGHVLETSTGNLVQVDLPDGGREPLGQTIRVHGDYEKTKDGKTLEVASIDPVPALTQTLAPGPRKVAVLLVNFSNDTRQPWTTDFARGVFFNNSDSV